MMIVTKREELGNLSDDDGYDNDDDAENNLIKDEVSIR